jgi:hypothetical protein
MTAPGLDPAGLSRSIPPPRHALVWAGFAVLAPVPVFDQFFSSRPFFPFAAA